MIIRILAIVVHCIQHYLRRYQQIRAEQRTDKWEPATRFLLYDCSTLYMPIAIRALVGSTFDHLVTWTQGARESLPVLKDLNMLHTVQSSSPNRCICMLWPDQPSGWALDALSATGVAAKQVANPQGANSDCNHVPIRSHAFLYSLMHIIE